jgi:hypothetical protein
VTSTLRISTAGELLGSDELYNYPLIPTTRTPLHCAVAYSNLVVTRYLVEHGASLFLATKDGDTPLHIAEEECKLVKAGQQERESGEDRGTLETAVQCLDYLKGTQLLPDELVNLDAIQLKST